MGKHSDDVAVLLGPIGQFLVLCDDRAVVGGVQRDLFVLGIRLRRILDKSDVSVLLRVFREDSRRTKELLVGLCEVVCGHSKGEQLLALAALHVLVRAEQGSTGFVANPQV